MSRSEQSLAAERAAFLRRRGDDGRLMPGPIGPTEGKVPEHYWCQCDPPTLKGNCVTCKLGWKDRGLPKLCLVDGRLYVEGTMLPFSETPFVAGVRLMPPHASELPRQQPPDDRAEGDRAGEPPFTEPTTPSRSHQPDQGDDAVYHTPEEQVAAADPAPPSAQLQSDDVSKLRQETGRTGRIGRFTQDGQPPFTDTPAPQSSPVPAQTASSGSAVVESGLPFETATARLLPAVATHFRQLIGAGPAQPFAGSKFDRQDALTPRASSLTRATIGEQQEQSTYAPQLLQGGLRRQGPFKPQDERLLQEIRKQEDDRRLLEEKFEEDIRLERLKHSEISVQLLTTSETAKLHEQELAEARSKLAQQARELEEANAKAAKSEQKCDSLTGMHSELNTKYDEMCRFVDNEPQRNAWRTNEADDYCQRLNQRMAALNEELEELKRKGNKANEAPREAQRANVASSAEPKRDEQREELRNPEKPRDASGDGSETSETKRERKGPESPSAGPQDQSPPKSGWDNIEPERKQTSEEFQKQAHWGYSRTLGKQWEEPEASDAKPQEENGGADKAHKQKEPAKRSEPNQGTQTGRERETPKREPFTRDRQAPLPYDDDVSDAAQSRSSRHSGRRSTHSRRHGDSEDMLCKAVLAIERLAFNGGGKGRSKGEYDEKSLVGDSHAAKNHDVPLLSDINSDFKPEYLWKWELFRRKFESHLLFVYHREDVGKAMWEQIINGVDHAISEYYESADTQKPYVMPECNFDSQFQKLSRRLYENLCGKFSNVIQARVTSLNHGAERAYGRIEDAIYFTKLWCAPYTVTQKHRCSEAFCKQEIRWKSMTHGSLTFDDIIVKWQNRVRVLERHGALCETYDYEPLMRLFRDALSALPDAGAGHLFHLELGSHNRRYVVPEFTNKIHFDTFINEIRELYCAHTGGEVKPTYLPGVSIKHEGKTSTSRASSVGSNWSERIRGERPKTPPPRRDGHRQPSGERRERTPVRDGARPTTPRRSPSIERRPARADPVRANYAEQAAGLTFANDEARRYFVAFGKPWQGSHSPDDQRERPFTEDGDVFTNDGGAKPVDEDFIDEYEEYCFLCGTHAVWEHDIAFNFLSNDDFHVYPAGPQHGEHAFVVIGKRRCDDDKCGCVTNEKCTHRGKDLKCDVCGRAGHDKHSCWQDKPYLDERVVKPNRVLKKAPR